MTWNKGYGGGPGNWIGRDKSIHFMELGMTETACGMKPRIGLRTTSRRGIHGATCLKCRKTDIFKNEPIK